PLTALLEGAHIELAKLCARALSERPEERYASPEEFAEQFASVIDTGRLLADAPSAADKSAPQPPNARPSPPKIPPLPSAALAPPPVPPKMPLPPNPSAAAASVDPLGTAELDRAARAHDPSHEERRETTATVIAPTPVQASSSPLTYLLLLALIVALVVAASNPGPKKVVELEPALATPGAVSEREPAPAPSVLIDFSHAFATERIGEKRPKQGYTFLTVIYDAVNPSDTSVRDPVSGSTLSGADGGLYAYERVGLDAIPELVRRSTTPSSATFEIPICALTGDLELRVRDRNILIERASIKGLPEGQGCAAKPTPEGEGARRLDAPQDEPAPKTRCPAGMALIKSSRGRYCIDRYEYPGKGALPKVGVSWFGAQKACERKGARLCSLAEWRRGCGRKHSYSNRWDPNKCNTQDEDDFERSLTLAGEFKRCRSSSGVYDMVGNAHEWVAEQKIVGGGFDSGEDVASCNYSSSKLPGSKAGYLGFRCCADLE
ncbi:MAG: SUMF1/EgtB/PvdO family nonheme iron enzyme, partial [Myxococcota bacterium]